MPLDNVKHIVLILSGKGGVGKSSITTQLAFSLCLAGHSVGILDVDLTGPSIPRLLSLEAAKITQAPGGWLPVEVHASQTLPPPPVQAPSPNPTKNGLGTQNGDASAASVSPLFPAPQPTTTTTATANDTPTTQKIGALHVISLGFLLPSRSSAVVWRGPKKTAMIRQFMSDVLWPPLDYLLIDTPPGTSDEHISLAETLLFAPPPTTATNGSASPVSKLAGAVVVTTPQAVAVSDVRKELNFCKKVGIEVLGVVENMSGYVCECCGVGTNLFGKGGGEVMAGEFGVRFLGRVPVDGQWGVLVEEGRRPRYGGDGWTSEDGEEDDGERIGGSGRAERDAGLLVDKYRSCSLYGVFEGISKQMADIVEAQSSNG
ncbi:MAG: hypothetical protein LQ342_006476 [Letrouitia transgressa]|nr:MAG: hypothetical protein LQ342_006476 [Letrouitia transgressa]